jgi:hypothetical protein
MSDRDHITPSQATSSLEAEIELSRREFGGWLGT